jgi:hypothetical protein
MNSTADGKGNTATRVIEARRLRGLLEKESVKRIRIFYKICGRELDLGFLDYVGQLSADT